MTDHQILRSVQRVRQILEKYGWQQGAFGPEVASDGPHCLVGAINTACREKDSIYSYAKDLAKYRVRQVISHTTETQSTTGLVLWNDELERTKREVINLLLDTETRLKGNIAAVSKA